MARKTGTLEQQRESVIRRGRAANKEITADASLVDVERRMKQETLVLLKAAGFSHTYCADALGVARSTITAWLADEDLNLSDKIEKTHEKMIASTVKLMQSYSLEIVQMLMDIARTTDNEERAVKIGFEILDRLGLAKVNKSESISAATVREEREVNIVDRTGILEVAKHAPPEVQAALASRVEDLIALASEHRQIAAPAAEEAPDA